MPMSERAEQLLRGLWQWGQRTGERHRRALDLGIALAVAALSIVGLAAQHRLGDTALIVWCAALCAPLTLRRRSPSLAFAGVALVCLLVWLFSQPQLAGAAVLVALYWVARDGELVQVAIAAGVTGAGAIMAAVQWSPADPLRAWVGLSGLTVAAAFLGVTVRQRRDLIASLHERAARLEFERDQEGRLGAAAERARIAREMHDIVSHNLTVMISLADGAGYAMDTSPQSAQAAIERLSATGRQALLEMRRLLGVLQEEPDPRPLEPQPSLERLDDLIARVNAAGIPVSIEIAGEPRTLAAGVQLTVFRVAQEALTNTLKHAGRPASAHVALRCQPDQIDLEVIDTGSGGVLVGAPAGRGLRGMRERAAAYGGQLEAGPLSQGGWRVHLSMHADDGDGGPR
jgi:signal transduction histidine kinase